MLLKLYGVLDVKAETFRSMHFLSSDGVAIRQFGDAVCDPKTYLAKHPEDFALYYLADFDDESGEVRSVIPIKFVARASEFVNKINCDMKIEEAMQ